jgi:hypothetical protein
MPRFTYSLDAERTQTGSQDLVLADAECARYAAKSIARLLASREVESGTLDLSKHLSIQDESGATIHTLPLGQAVRIIGS